MKEQQANHKNNYEDVLNRIQVSRELSGLEESLRHEIWMQVKWRAGKTKRRSMRFRLISAAASVALLISVTGFLSYKLGYNQRVSQYVHLTTPTGMRSTVDLSDGSVITLNTGTTLSYPTEFLSGIREVELKGEAYFDVAFDNKRPFVVKAADIRVHVLSTQFNIKAYEEDRMVEVTLEEGLIRIESDEWDEPLFIHPGEQLRLNKVTGEYIHHPVPTENYTAWREGKLYFTGTPLVDIARELERKFNVSIAIESEKLQQITFTGDFVRNENLEQILRVMALDRSIRYHIDNTEVRIYENE